MPSIEYSEHIKVLLKFYHLPPIFGPIIGLALQRPELKPFEWKDDLGIHHSWHPLAGSPNINWFTPEWHDAVIQAERNSLLGYAFFIIMMDKTGWSKDKFAQDEFPTFQLLVDFIGFNFLAVAVETYLGELIATLDVQKAAEDSLYTAAGSAIVGFIIAELFAAMWGVAKATKCATINPAEEGIATPLLMDADANNGSSAITPQLASRPAPSLQALADANRDPENDPLASMRTPAVGSNERGGWAGIGSPC